MSFDTIKHKISNIVLDSVKRRLWYLTPELVVLSFFNKDVGSDEKRAEQLLKDFLLLKDLESLMLASLLLTLSKIACGGHLGKCSIGHNSVTFCPISIIFTFSQSF